MRNEDKITSSADALAAWRRKYGPRRVMIRMKDKVPFEAGRFLGRGGSGIVVETRIDGITMAWKTTHAPKLTKQLVNEVTILRQISERKHKHVVELIGSYMHRQQNRMYELGLLIWPAAKCNLSEFLLDIDALAVYYDQKYISNKPNTLLSNEDQHSVLESLSTLLSLNFHGAIPPKQECANVYWSAMKRLKQSFGCIAEAIAYLHRNGFRHKDFKTSQVLLSSHGTWVTDFGWSNAASEPTNNTTSGNDTITAKYHAPERERGEPCGRPEDIFGLGCSYLEMAYRVIHDTPEVHLKTRSKPQWSYQDNLAYIDTWLLPFETKEPSTGSYLGNLVRQMLERNPQERPSIQKVLAQLRAFNPRDEYNFFGKCCSSSEYTVSARHRQSSCRRKLLTFMKKSRYAKQISRHPSLVFHSLCQRLQVLQQLVSEVKLNHQRNQAERTTFPSSQPPAECLKSEGACCSSTFRVRPITATGNTTVNSTVMQLILATLRLGDLELREGKQHHEATHTGDTIVLPARRRLTVRTGVPCPITILDTRNVDVNMDKSDKIRTPGLGKGTMAMGAGQHSTITHMSHLADPAIRAWERAESNVVDARHPALQYMTALMVKADVPSYWYQRERNLKYLFRNTWNGVGIEIQRLFGALARTGMEFSIDSLSAIKIEESRANS